MYRNRPEIVAAICERLSQGEPLAQICRDEGMPGHVTVWEWQQADSSVSEAIAQAREAGEERIAADCLEIADHKADDYIEGENGPILNAEHIQRSKLRIETRLKLLAKWNPKKWGDRQTVEHQGKIGLEHLVGGGE